MSHCREPLLDDIRPVRNLKQGLSGAMSESHLTHTKPEAEDQRSLFQDYQAGAKGVGTAIYLDNQHFDIQRLLHDSLCLLRILERLYFCWQAADSSSITNL